MNGQAEKPTYEMWLNLQYQHGTGHLAPYFDGLKEGRAVASYCPNCGRSWFPPRVVCPYDRTQTEWKTVSGDGVIVSVTSTRTKLPFTETASDYRFVLVAMQDTENAVFGRMQSHAADVSVGAHVTLAVPLKPSGHPAQAVQFRPRDDSSIAVAHTLPEGL